MDIESSCACERKLISKHFWGCWVFCKFTWELVMLKILLPIKGGLHMIHTMLSHSRKLSLVSFDCSVQLSLHSIMKSTSPYSHAASLYFHAGLLVLMVLYSLCHTWRHANIYAFTLHLVNFVNFAAPYFWLQAHAIIEIY